MINQKGKYELDIVNIEKQICESHRAEKKQEEIRAVTCIKSTVTHITFLNTLRNTPIPFHILVHSLMSWANLQMTCLTCAIYS